jgi:4-coumarate--CoA ligase
MLSRNSKGEEAPRAYIVLNQEQKATAEDINAFMATRISKSKRLTGGVCFTDAIPKNPVSRGSRLISQLKLMKV